MARGRATDTSALVAAAAEVFERKGFRNATIDDVAEAHNARTASAWSAGPMTAVALSGQVLAAAKIAGRRVSQLLTDRAEGVDGPR